MEMKGALTAIVISDMWEQWKQSTSDTVVDVKQLKLDDQFWVDVKFVVELVELICDIFAMQTQMFHV